MRPLIQNIECIYSYTNEIDNIKLNEFTQYIIIIKNRRIHQIGERVE